MAKILGSWAGARMGKINGAVDSIRAGIAVLDAINYYWGRGGLLSRLAEAQAVTGAVDDAFVTVEQALESNPDELWYRSLMLQLRGELRLRCERGGATRLDLAERDFREAIELAREMSAKSPELRATTSLARMLASQGRRDEARTMLAEIYNWFTEGFDTLALKEAEALLDELSA
jgi:tetratricopeptide (TPR) repeat protein